VRGGSHDILVLEKLVRWRNTVTHIRNDERKKERKNVVCVKEGQEKSKIGDVE
jgi:hypothetical protein